MKKFLLYFFGLIFICFVLPAFLTKTEMQVTAEGDTNKIESEEEYNYKQYGTINLLHKETGQVETVDIDKYLCNVVSAEMPVDYEMEALKAQSVVARTYTIYKCINKKHENADICDDSNCCQAWISKEDRLARWEDDKKDSNWAKIEQCVNETKGKIITYNNAPINAFFHSNSGGKTEIPTNVWGGGEYPYLQVIETSGEEGYSQYNSEMEFSNEELINKLKTKYQDIQIDFNNPEDIKILEYTESNRVKTIKFGNHNLSGVETRSLLGLKSANFEITRQDNKIKFTVKGYGHGVGMSQTGADSLAKQGKSYEEIIHHFYSNVQISEI